MGIALVRGAHAGGGINLTWGEGCWADNPQTVQTFACDTNVGTFAMTASFVPSIDIRQFDIFQFEIDLQADSPNLPDWWQFCSVGGCRNGALTGTAAFNSTVGACAFAWPGSSPTLALNWRTPGACGGGVIAANRGQVFGTVSIPGVVDTTAHRGTEYYAVRLNIDAQKTIGGAACGGCSVPVTIVLNEIDLGGVGEDKITSPLANTCLRWQAAGTTPCSATPVRNMTWGAIKSFYR
ncbi:MAG TPA: hypothetical protein VMJ70_04445 [Candidatus Sulfotelmatobacter sp.]|nr:hypothetical protein [Candidatus Sulfotelmatobacter sp.]